MIIPSYVSGSFANARLQQSVRLDIQGETSRRVLVESPAKRVDLVAVLDRDAVAASIPLKRLATPEDIADPILFLLSDHARYITGQTLYVNGGAYMP